MNLDLTAEELDVIDDILMFCEHNHHYDDGMRDAFDEKTCESMRKAFKSLQTKVGELMKEIKR